MKKIILSTLFFLILFACPKIDEKKWTILIYMAADNALNNYAIADIEEMINAEFSEEINIIVQIDYSENNSQTGTYRYKIFPGENLMIDYLGEIDSGDGNQLSGFANWGFSKYPAEKNALFIWGHGNGWYSDENASFCTDNQSENYIKMADGEFCDAIKNINEHLDILVLDACNMQTLEVAAEIYQEVDYIIAAEDGIDDQGFPYQVIFSEWEDFSDTENLAKQIGFNFHYFYWEQEILPISCSVLKTSEFPNVIAKIECFTQNWNFNSSNEIFTQSREECLEFNETFDVNPAMDVDVREWFVNLLNQSLENADYELIIFYQEIISVIDSAYIFQKTEEYEVGYSNEVGSALIWFPDSEAIGFFEDRKKEYENLVFSEAGWLGFLNGSFQR